MMKPVEPKVIYVNLNKNEDQVIDLEREYKNYPKAYENIKCLSNMEEYCPETFMNPIDFMRIQDLAYYLTIGVTYQNTKMIVAAYGGTGNAPNDSHFIALNLSKYYGINIVKEIETITDKLRTLIKNGFSINELETIVYMSNGFMDARTRIDDAIERNPVRFTTNNEQF